MTAQTYDVRAEILRVLREHNPGGMSAAGIFDHMRDRSATASVNSLYLDHIAPMVADRVLGFYPEATWTVYFELPTGGAR